MSEDYFLYSKSGNRDICLGKKGNDEVPYFRVEWINGDYYNFSKDLFNVLEQRFTNAHSDAIILDSYDLFDSGNYVQPDEDTISVGGDEDNAIPLTEYLPELNNPDELIEKGWLVLQPD